MLRSSRHHPARRPPGRYLGSPQAAAVSRRRVRAPSRGAAAARPALHVHHQCRGGLPRACCPPRLALFQLPSVATRRLLDKS